MTKAKATAPRGGVEWWSRPGWAELALVCRDCRKRSNGPARLKAKAVLAELRQALKAAKPRPRVVSTSCLGPCPKGAMTIAFVGAAGVPRHGEVASLRQVAALAALLAAPTAAGDEAGVAGDAA